MERLRDFLTRYQEVNAVIGLFVNESEAYGLKQQKVLIHFYDEYGDTKAFSEILFDLVLDKSNVHRTRLLLDSIKKEAERTIELFDNYEDDPNAVDMDIVNGEIEIRYIDEVEKQIEVTCDLGNKFLKLKEAFGKSLKALEKMNIHNDDQYWREYDRMLEDHYKAVVSLHELYEKHWQAVSESKKYDKNVFDLIYDMSGNFLHIIEKYEQPIPESELIEHPNAMEAKESTKLQAIPYFEMGLISNVYKTCVGEQFEDMAEVDFYSSMNLMATDASLRIRSNEKSRVCYLIYLLSEQLEKSIREEWRSGILTQLNISSTYYKSKYKEAANRYSSKKNKEFAANMKEIFE